MAHRQMFPRVAGRSCMNQSILLARRKMTDVSQDTISGQQGTCKRGKGARRHEMGTCCVCLTTPQGQILSGVYRSSGAIEAKRPGVRLKCMTIILRWKC